MKKYIIFIVCLLVLSISNVFAYDTIKDTYYYTSIDVNNLSDTFIYSDEYFSNSSFIGNSNLEILSIQVAGASASCFENNSESYNIIDMLTKMKFNNITTNKYYDKDSEENSIALTIANKKIIVNNKEYVLLAIIPRSAGYDKEWAGNFYTGNQDIHLGFKIARDEVLRFTKKYINDNNINGDIKVWLAGRSRAGAISNMVGAYLVDSTDYFDNKITVKPENLYCYTFASPRVVKNKLNKNIELSVSSNKYENDTVDSEYTYTKGGILDLTSDKYNGIKNIVSPYDLVTFVPLESWNYKRYGIDYSVNHNIVSDSDMVNELKNINSYAYDLYVKSGNPNTFKLKTFDLKSLSIIDETNKEMDAKTFINNKALALSNIASTNSKYTQDNYEEVFMALAATFGMGYPVLEIDNIDLNTLVYVYIDYASNRLKSDGINKTDSEVISIIIGDLLNYYSDLNIDSNSYTLDDFIKVLFKYVADNPDSELSNMVVSIIENAIPNNYKFLLSTFKMFDTSKGSEKDWIKAFIKACYYGPDEKSSAKSFYKNGKEVRKIIYSIVPLLIRKELPNTFVNFKEDTKFETVIDSILKDKNIDNISNISEKKFSELLDNMFNKTIINSEKIYGLEYKNKLNNYVNVLKSNPKIVSEILMNILFYNDKKYNASDDLISVITFFNNASIIPLAHSNEVYLAYAKASKNYNNIYENNKEIKKDNNKYIYIIIIIICIASLLLKIFLEKNKKD